MLHPRALKKYIRLGQLTAVTVASVVGLSGCFFGNREIDPAGPSAIQGNYESAITSIEVCASKNVTTNGNTQEQTNCANVGINSLVDGSSSYYLFNQTDSNLANQTMSDPVFLSYDSGSGLFTLQPPGLSNPDFVFIVASDNQGDLQTPSTVSYTPFSHLMPDTHPNCDFNMEYQAAGTYGQSNGPFTTRTSLPLSGRIAMNFDVIFSPNGTDCSQLAACYNGASGCDANDNEIVQAEFSGAIKAGVMSAADIPNLLSLEYRVSYQ